MIAALYVDELGPYMRMAGVDPWGITRDARRYKGPYPIVAHPDCGPWGKLRHLYRGNGHDCAPRAVAQVRRWGGVLEHPAHSRLWAHAGLPLPGAPRDAWGGWTIEVCQVDWGHVARKRTWLYLVGVSPALAAQRPPPGTPTHWISGRREEQPAALAGRARGRSYGLAPPGIKICSEQQRRRTPPAFAAWLIAMAESVTPRSRFQAPRLAGTQPRSAGSPPSAATDPPRGRRRPPQP